LKITAYTAVENMGWTVNAFEIECDKKGVSPSDFKIDANEYGMVRESVAAVIAVTEIPSGLRLEVEPVGYKSFKLVGTGVAEGISFGYEDVSDVKTVWADLFEAKDNGIVHYRLYSPKAGEARPLTLFLHGGGESGSDNWTQMVGTIGAAKIAKDYPDYYVFAPQAPGGGITPGNAPVMPRNFSESGKMGPGGWTREYLAGVCDVIKGMIAEGKVDPDRVYVTGMSMGGGGTLRALSVGSGLFAAAVAICPTMTPETYGILKSLTDTKIWVATAYVDHTIYRHKYIVDGLVAIKDAGNPDAHLTLYAPEDLEKYGLSTDPNMPIERKFGSNHASWILVYNNEEGIMDWLMSRVK